MEVNVMRHLVQNSERTQSARHYVSAQSQHSTHKRHANSGLGYFNNNAPKRTGRQIRLSDLIRSSARQRGVTLYGNKKNAGGCNPPGRNTSSRH